jgi:type I restriction enzyme S subunit
MSFPKYPAYKPSGVEWLGDVPAHWEVKRLKRACLVFPSNVDKKSYDGEKSVSLCNYTDVYYNENIIFGMNFMSATATDEQITKFTLRAGDTIITKDSETSDDIAIAAYVPNDLPGVICGYHLSMVRPQGETYGPFIKCFFDSKIAKAQFEVAANGLTRVGLSQYAIDNVHCPYPPKNEQSAIAAFLTRETSKIDALIAEQQKLIALLKEKRQAVISHAVTKGLDPSVPMKDSGVAWLGEVPAHWEVRALRRVIAGIEQGWSPECYAREADEQEWGVLKAGCINGGIFRQSENKALPPELLPETAYEVRAGDILMSRASGSPELVGSTALVTATRERLMLSDKIFRLKLQDAVSSHFFVASLNSRALRVQIENALSGGNGMANNLPQSSLLSFAMAVPPASEQPAITAFLDCETAKLDNLTSEAQSAITLLQERRTALISAAVTGQIKVTAD